MDQNLFPCPEMFVFTLINFGYINFKTTSLLNHIKYLQSVRTITPACNLLVLGFDRGGWSGHVFNVAQLCVDSRATAPLRSRPNSMRGLLSKTRQVLASDRCGISVRCELCQRAGLVQREEMTWLSWAQYVFVPWPPGQVMAGIQKEKLYSCTCHQPPLHPFHHKALCTSWLLPETIRSPLVPFALLPSMSSPSPNTTAALGWRTVMNQNLTSFSFARLSLLSQIWISD